MREYLTRKMRRLGFFFREAARGLLPDSRYYQRLALVFGALAGQDFSPEVYARVNYYNRLDQAFVLGDSTPRARDLSRQQEGTFYYYDFKEVLRYFPADLRLNWLLGDNILIPEQPAIVKSRPIGNENRNAVVLKLDKLRHYDLYQFKDRLAFRDKRSAAVWRGILNNPLRVALVSRYAGDPRHDVAYVEKPRLQCDKPPGSPLKVSRQLEYRYVLSVEGYDVATNLKWIFGSNSLCLMPRPRYETWFMEGTLEAGEHYVELRDDFADLDEKIAWYDSHLAEAEAIIENAHRHYRQFSDARNETLVSLLVLQKYFERSGQVQPQPFSGRYFRGT